MEVNRERKRSEFKGNERKNLKVIKKWMKEND